MSSGTSSSSPTALPHDDAGAKLFASTYVTRLSRAMNDPAAPLPSEQGASCLWCQGLQQLITGGRAKGKTYSGDFCPQRRPVTVTHERLDGPGPVAHVICEATRIREVRGGQPGQATDLGRRWLKMHLAWTTNGWQITTIGQVWL